MVLHITKNNPV